MRDALDRDTVFRYDALDRLIEVEQQGVSPVLVTAFSYDAAGNVLTVTDPKDQVTTYAYDGLSRLLSVEQELGQTAGYAYDGRGRLTKVTNARGGDELVYGYAAWGGLTTLLYDEDADGEIDAGVERVVSYTHDDNGNVLAVSDTEVDASNPLYTFSYDGQDRVDTVTVDYVPGDPTLDPGYDRFGERSRLVLDDGDDPQLHAWAYDALGRLSDATLPGNPADLMFEHFDTDDVMQVVHGGTDVVMGLTYHPEGPVDAIDVSRGMDPLLLLDYTLDDVWNVDTVSEKRGTGTPEGFDYGYDGVDRLETADYPAAFGLPADEAWIYDDAGNRDDDDGMGSPAGTHAYDANNRITASPSRGYAFDADGNLETIDDGATPTPNALATLTWDATNRLRTYTDASSGLTAAYAYDPFGRRIRKIVDEDGAGMTHSPVTTWYLWDGDQLLAEYDASGSRQVRYAYAGGFAPLQVAYAGGQCDDGLDNDGDGDTDYAGGDAECASAADPLEGPAPTSGQCDDTVDNDGDGDADYPADADCSSATDPTESNQERVYDVHADHLDTPRMLTDAAGSVVWRASYAAYGEAALDSGNTLPEAFNIRFPGQYYDDETGLAYNGHRYYSSELGRYISADPIGQTTDTNLYEYADSYPTGAIDPNGLVVWRILRKVFNSRGEAHFVPGGTASQAQAATAAARGGSVVASGPGAAQAARQLGKRLARQKKDRLLHHSPHHTTSPVFHPHYQLNKTGGHIYYKLAAGAGVVVGFIFIPAPVQAAQFLGNFLADSLIAGADYFIDGAAPIGQGASQDCGSQGGTPGGDDLAGQFLGGYGSLNRPR